MSSAPRPEARLAGGADEPIRRRAASALPGSPVVSTCTSTRARVAPAISCTSAGRSTVSYTRRPAEQPDLVRLQLADEVHLDAGGAAARRLGEQLLGVVLTDRRATGRGAQPIASGRSPSSPPAARRRRHPPAAMRSPATRRQPATRRRSGAASSALGTTGRRSRRRRRRRRASIGLGLGEQLGDRRSGGRRRQRRAGVDRAVEAGGDDGDLDLVAHLVVDHRAEDDVGVLDGRRRG